MVTVLQEKCNLLF